MVGGRRENSGAPWGRCVLVWLLTTAACGAGAATCLRVLGPVPHEVLGTGLDTLGDAGASFDALLVTTAAIVGALSLGWIWLVATVTVVEAARGRVPARSGGPLRRIVLAACGGALLLGSAAPALAADLYPHRDADRMGPGELRGSVAGLPFPDRATEPQAVAPIDPAADPAALSPAVPAAARRADPPVTTSIAAPQRRSVRDGAPRMRVVEQGDTLWALAADTLPSSATTADVDRRWRQIHRSNQDVVGEDPDLIVPGQSLRLPTTDLSGGNS